MKNKKNKKRKKMAKNKDKLLKRRFGFSQKDDMSVVNDLKEPMTLRRFYEEYIYEPLVSIKKVLDERGILFFFRSGFQFRNRLLIKVMIIVICFISGVIPRSIAIVQNEKIQNAKSEISKLEDKTYSFGNISVSALASSYYKDKHIIIFDIFGETSAGVASTNEGFDVALFPIRGATDVEKMSYSYKIVPMTVNSRLLILSIDTKNQNDDAGIYGFIVSPKGVPINYDYGMPLAITRTQQTSDIYTGKDFVSLTPLSQVLTNGNKVSHTIENAEATLKEQLNVYKINEDRLNSIGIKLKLTAADLEAYVNKHLILTSVKDDSTSKIVSVKVPEIRPIMLPKIEIEESGKIYDATTVRGKDDVDYESTRAIEFPNIVSSTDAVLSAANDLNNARVTKYRELYDLSRLLNNPVSFDGFTDMGHPIIDQ